MLDHTNLAAKDPAPEGSGVALSSLLPRAKLNSTSSTANALAKARKSIERANALREPGHCAEAVAVYEEVIRQLPCGRSSRGGAARIFRVNQTATSPYSVSHGHDESRNRPLRFRWLLGLAALAVLAVLLWQGVTAGGNPDPAHPHATPTAAVFDIGVLVFREGLECVLVLSAITAGLTGPGQTHRRPIAAGAGIGFAATLVTWFVAAGILSKLADSIPALGLQAGTGLLAVLVLLIVMNWFFHKLYWGGWISLHNSRKRELIAEDSQGTITPRRLWLGLALLGFSSLYREGFEVVLFLQTYFLQLGGKIVLLGTLIGLALTAAVAILNFVAHRRLPYRRMLVFTGILLGIVLLVMVGEEAQEMQLAHWIATTPIPALTSIIPDWMGLWFSVFPTIETLVAQIIAAAFVVGCFFLAKRRSTPSATSAR